MPQNIGDNRIIESGIARITHADAERLTRYRVRRGDIIYSRRGDVERRSLVREDEHGWLCGTGCLRVRLGEGVADPEYAAFYLGHPAVREWIVRHAHGATMPNLNTSILSACPFVLPPIAVQRSIASLLTLLDDKIELNRRMNETLETMARAIFKDWFVDFGPTRAKLEGRAPYLAPEIWRLFPDRLADEISDLPQGWHRNSILSQAEWVNGAAYKNMHFSDDTDALPVIKIAELKSGVTSQTKRTSTQLGERYRIADGELLFSWSGNPDTSIGTFVWTGGAAWLNQHIFSVRENGKASLTLLYYLLKTFTPEFAEIARNKQTTGLGHVTKGDMERMLFAVGDAQVRDAFERLAKPLHDRMIANLFENRTLAAARNLLLCKLMSGEIRIRDAEAMVAAAA